MSFQKALEKMVADGYLQRDEPTPVAADTPQEVPEIQTDHAGELAANPFLQSYLIPFPFSLEIKERLSGLSANSGGNGWSRNTKIHVYDLKRGYLCGKSTARYGANWSGTLGDGYYNAASVTCRECLKRIEKYKK